MAAGSEVARAVVTLIPSMQGSQAAITKELTGVSTTAGKTAGNAVGNSMVSSISSTMSSAGSRTNGCKRDRHTLGQRLAGRTHSR